MLAPNKGRDTTTPPATHLRLTDGWWMDGWADSYRWTRASECTLLKKVGHGVDWERAAAPRFFLSVKREEEVGSQRRVQGAWGLCCRLSLHYCVCV